MNERIAVAGSIHKYGAIPGQSVSHEHSGMLNLASRHGYTGGSGPTPSGKVPVMSHPSGHSLTVTPNGGWVHNSEAGQVVGKGAKALGEHLEGIHGPAPEPMKVPKPEMPHVAPVADHKDPLPSFHSEPERNSADMDMTDDYASGGNWIAGATSHNKGKFTEKAHAAGESVQQFANQVTAPGSHTSTTTKREANLAKTLGSLHK